MSQPVVYLKGSEVLILSGAGVAVAGLVWLIWPEEFDDSLPREGEVEGKYEWAPPQPFVVSVSRKPREKPIITLHCILFACNCNGVISFLLYCKAITNYHAWCKMSSYHHQHWPLPFQDQVAPSRANIRYNDQAFHNKIWKRFLRKNLQRHHWNLILTIHNLPPPRKFL